MIEAVVKVGGSLSRGDRLPALCQQLGDSGRRHPLLVVPGGGPFADAVREQDRRFGLGATAAHWMAILGMDQYGWQLAELIPGSEPVWDLATARAVAAAGRLPVLLPFALLHAADPLPHTWQVTSDSIAAWVAATVGAPLLILLKDVDGLLDSSPGEGTAPRLQTSVSLARLAQSEGVDSHLAHLLRRFGLELWILNGERPARLAELQARGFTLGTHWRPRAS